MLLSAEPLSRWHSAMALAAQDSRKVPASPNDPVFALQRAAAAISQLAFYPDGRGCCHASLPGRKRAVTSAPSAPSARTLRPASVGQLDMGSKSLCPPGPDPVTATADRVSISFYPQSGAISHRSSKRVSEFWHIDRTARGRSVLRSARRTRHPEGDGVGRTDVSHRTSGHCRQFKSGGQSN